MWIASGPFDGEVAGEVSFQKSKLLKTGCKYLLGRKDDCALMINHKKVSKSCGEFTVSKFSVDDVTNPSAVPRLDLCNTKDKIMLVSRGSETLSINPSATQDLQDGDVVTVAGGIGITVHWVRVSCYLPPLEGRNRVSLQDCAILGISTTSTCSHESTHHLVSSYAINAVIAASLISATQLVKPEWLEEVIRLGTLPAKSDGPNGTPLERTFSLPPATKFRPVLPGTLPPPLRSVKVWEPNEERLALFQRFKFIFVGEQGREVGGDMKELLRRGDGQLETFAVHEGKARWHEALSKSKRQVPQDDRGKALVIISDQKLMSASLGNSLWNEFVEVARSLNLRFISAEEILHAVLYVDVSYIDCAAPTAQDDDVPPSSLPSFVPNTHSLEPSIPISDDGQVPTTDMLAQSSPEIILPSARLASSHLSNIEIPMPGRKPLARRTKAITPATADSKDLSTVFEVASTVPTNEKLSAPPPAMRLPTFDVNASIPTRSSRLKRRAGTTASSQSSTLPGAVVLGGTIEPSIEPPLKKFKALFESSNPQKASQEGIESFSNTRTASTHGTEGWASEDRIFDRNGQHSPQWSVSASATGGEGPVDEEHSKKKRKAVADEGGGLVSQAIPSLAAKRQTTDIVSQRGKRPAPLADRAAPVILNDRESGIASGTPDTDAAFLKALASTKRGKRSEDDFDREFNQLRIHKPEFQRETNEDEWAVLADFGQDLDVRGNFMVVVDMPIRRRSKAVSEPTATQVEWQFRANFKRFKRKVAPGRRAKVDLIATQESDYGVGLGYWKGNKSQSQPQSQRESDNLHAPSQKRTQKSMQPHNKARNRSGYAVVDSGGVMGQASCSGGLPAFPSPANTPQNSQIPSEGVESLFSGRDRARALGGLREKDLDLDHNGTILEASAVVEVRSETIPTVVTKGGRKTLPVISHDDSEDEGATFKGFRGRRTRSGR